MVNKVALKRFEWLAENAFLTPGKHRLLTAAGLSAGLYGGRELMDVITARKAMRDKPLEREDTLQALRPLHGGGLLLSAGHPAGETAPSPAARLDAAG